MVSTRRQKRQRTINKQDQQQSKRNNKKKLKQQKKKRKELQKQQNKIHKQQRIYKVIHQKMYLLEVIHNEKQWIFTVQGVKCNNQSTGNSYKIKMNLKKIQCGCIDFRIRRKVCKHLYFIIIKIAQQNDLLQKINVNPKLNKNIFQKLSKSLLNKLKKRLQTNQSIQKNLDFGQDKECIICFQQLTQQNNLQCIQCKKFQHKDCINKWLQQKETCPLCRGLWIRGQGAFSFLSTKNIKL